VSIGNTVVPQEIEAKYRLDDPAGLRRRLVACGAQPGGRVLEGNRMFDTAERSLQAADCGLRLRTCRSLEDGRPLSATLTYKGPRNVGALKVREEVETEVADPSSVATILRRLGFNEVVFYEKRRETWRLGECEVCVDELPQLGWFVEIEGPSKEAIATVSEKLGASDQVALRETYVEIVATHGTREGTDTVGLTFEP
jgi:adenylate cyclase class 2